MATSPLSEFIQHLRIASSLNNGAGLTDGQLLGRFVEHRDEAAFAALVKKHGPMVWNVCRRLLQEQDAQDAFQATFFVLVRRAASVKPREMVANFLYGVAHRIAVKARAVATKRKGRERQVREMPEPAVEGDLWNDLRPLIDQELSRLPDKYRVVIVLCDLEGKTRKEAARQLRCPEGTVATRLKQAREMLAKRLSRLGLPVSGGVLATVLSQQAASALMPPLVVSSTIKAATLLAAGQTVAGGLISSKVIALSEGVMKAMMLSKTKIGMMALLVVAMTGVGGGGIFYGVRAVRAPHAGERGVFVQTGVDEAAISHPPAEIQPPQVPVADAQRPKVAGNRDWPLFGGNLSRNMVNARDKNIAAKWSVGDGKNIKWSADLGSKAYGGPVVSGGKVLVGTNNQMPRDPNITGDKGIIMCFRELDGSFLWQAAHDKLPSGRINDWPRDGTWSTPVVEGNRFYYVSNRSQVVCADTSNGKPIWALDMIGSLGVFPHQRATCSPLIVGKALFVVTGNGVDEGHINVPNPAAPSFIAVDKQNGNVLWQDNSPGNNIMHAQWSNPAFARIGGRPQVIFPGGDGWLRGFDPKNGTLIWKFDCNPKASKHALGGKGTKSDFLATPVVYANKVYIGVGQDPEHDEGEGHLWCIDPSKAKRGHEDISPAEDNFDRKADVNKKSGLVWHFGGPADPKKTGRNYYFGRTMSTCAIADGLVYAAELAGYLHCLDAQTGKEYWQHNMKSQTWVSPYWVDGKVYMGNDNGHVYVFQHGKQKKVLAENDMQSRVRATPVVANGVLYIMTENKLYAIANK